MNATQERTYRWYVHPKCRQADESIAAYLAENGISKDESWHVSVVVDEKEYFGVYEVPSRYVNAITKCWKSDVLVFVREGVGKIRHNMLYARSGARIRRTAPYKKAAQEVLTIGTAKRKK